MRFAAPILLVGLIGLILPGMSLGQVPEPIKPGDGESGDMFGFSVALDGNTALINARGHEDGEQTGAVYVMHRGANGWEEEAKLVAEDLLSFYGFGQAVALHNDIALIGSTNTFNGIDFSGAAYIFQRKSGQWKQVTKLITNQPEVLGSFGLAVGLSDRFAIIGDPTSNYGEGPGAVYVFNEVGGEWIQAELLLPDDGKPFDRFGQSVAIFGRRIAVGATHAEGEGEGSGAVYIFEYINGEWQQTAKIFATDGTGGSNFGNSIALEGNRLLVGDTGNDEIARSGGAAYLYDFTAGLWQEKAKLTAPDTAPLDRFGNAVALGGEQALVGASHAGVDREMGPEAGAAYLFKKRRGIWEMVAKLTSDNPAPYKHFGSAIAMSQDAALVGEVPSSASTRYDEDTGSAYWFDLSTAGQQAAAALVHRKDALHASEAVLSFGLDQNYPNPFTSTTQIAFSLAEPGQVSLVVYDLLGRPVYILAEGVHAAGQYTVSLDERTLPKGVYYYRLDSASGSQTRQMVLH